MFGFFISLAAFAITFSAGRRSLGTGIASLVAVGYCYGVVRSRIPDGGSHFAFDAALLGLYAAQLSSPVTGELRQRLRKLTSWTTALMVWPLVCMAYGPFLGDAQPMLVQLVGLRAAVMFVPCILIGARLQERDFTPIALTLALLNCVALALGLVEYVFGIDAIMPRNHMTEVMYTSRDILASGSNYHRIPSMFINAHAYGGVMALTVPFLLQGLEGQRKFRILLFAGIAAAGVGVFLCGARTPVVILGLATVYLLLSLRMRAATLIGLLICVVGVGYLVMHVERLQRFETLGDTDYVQQRVASSMNLSFFDIIVKFPFGAGLASAWGTSIPFFLQNIARAQFGIENEYGRIAIEQGVPGLLLWLSFIVVSLFKKKGSQSVLSPAATTYTHAILLASWLDGCLGAGVLAAIPGTALMLLLVGIRFASPSTARVKAPVRQVGRPYEQRTPRRSIGGRVPAVGRAASS